MWPPTLESDVAIKGSSYEGRDHGQRIPDSGPGVWRDTEIRRVLDILALVAVHEQAIQHVTGIDKELRAPHRFKEVAGLRHFRHEIQEDLCTAVSIDRIHQACGMSALAERNLKPYKPFTDAAKFDWSGSPAEWVTAGN